VAIKGAYMNKLFLSLTVAVSFFLPASLMAAVTTGKPAPDYWSLMDTNGKSHSLAPYRGKHVVLEWFNYDCPFVMKHYGSGNMQKLQKEYTDKGVVWLSINSSAKGKQGNYSPEEMNRLAKERQVASTAILLDENGKVGQLFGAKTTPHMFIIDKNGNVVYQGAIDDKPSVDPADIPTARNYVKDALDSILAGQPVADASTKSYGCSVKY
jgi:peroxiredoxin